MRTANEMRAQIADRAAQDADFRARLLGDPRGAVNEELGVSLPEGMTLNVHEQGAGTVHLVLPPSSKLGERDLEAVTGSIGTIDLHVSNPDLNPANW